MLCPTPSGRQFDRQPDSCSAFTHRNGQRHVRERDVVERPASAMRAAGHATANGQEDLGEIRFVISFSCPLILLVPLFHSCDSKGGPLPLIPEACHDREGDHHLQQRCCDRLKGKAEMRAQVQAPGKPLLLAKDACKRQTREAREEQEERKMQDGGVRHKG